MNTNIKNRIKRWILILILFISMPYSFAQFYNGSQLSFGKNRVQFNDKFWTFYKFNRFDTYFYLNGKSLSIYLAKYADEHIQAIEKKLDYNLERRIQFIIYNRLSDLKESNIDLNNDEPYNIGGVTQIVGSKVFLYYDGNHENFKRQIKAGIAKVLINEVIYGQEITANVKNSTLITLPDWYTQGLISYLSEDWNIEIDNYVKDGILNGTYEKFNKLTGVQAIYAGHSIWKYIADKYGEDRIANILYMTKISRSVESGFLYVLGVSFKNFTREWLAYYDNWYYEFDKLQELPKGEEVIKNNKDKKIIQQFKISPDGYYSSYITNEIGKYKVWLYNNEKKKSKRIMKSGQRIDEKTDYSVPVLAWHPTSKRLSIITEKKGKIFLYYYNIEEKKFEKKRLFDFQKILSFSYSDDGKMLVVSGVLNGQTDIFVYNLGSHTYEQITKDIYDDFNPVFINKSKNIIFSSNRIHDTIQNSSKDSITIVNAKQDLFLYNYTSKTKLLRRLTNTELANETNPLVINNNYISYLSDRNGIINRFTGELDSAIHFIDTTTHYRYFMNSFLQTNYNRNILQYDICPDKEKRAEIIYYKGANHIYFGEMASTEKLEKKEMINTPYMDAVIKKQEERKIITEIASPEEKILPPKEIKKEKSKRFVFVHTNDSIPKRKTIDIDNYSFNDNTERKDSANKNINTIKNKITSTSDFTLPKQRNYDVEYMLDQLVGQVDFSYLNNTYQLFTNVGMPIFNNPGINALFKVGVKDLLEDYKIIGGVKLSADMDNTEYILSFENQKKRLDKQILYHRQSFKNIYSNAVIKQTSNELLYMLKWPFNQVLALKGTALVRNDREVFTAIDYANLLQENKYRYSTGLKAELTFDNTRNKGLNLYYGTRWKLFAEAYRQINQKNKQLNVIGFDIRNYQKISRTFIWANRFAVSTSFGSQKLIYYMGGVDNWLFPKFDTLTNVATNQNYAYQTLATNMRGFKQNIRNGNSFALYSSELRFPIIRYFSSRPLKSDFFNNFQVIGFFDVGTAWTGSNPYSDKNSLYTSTFSNGPITVNIVTQKEPIVAGYGWGLRTRVFGYFLRADWAWGIDDGVVQPRVFYLSLSLDF